MQFVKGKPPETQNATCPGACGKRREVALGRPGFEPGRIRAWLSLRPSQGQSTAVATATISGAGNSLRDHQSWTGGSILNSHFNSFQRSCAHCVSASLYRCCVRIPNKQRLPGRYESKCEDAVDGVDDVDSPDTEALAN
jgi:hypothetical protein